MKHLLGLTLIGMILMSSCSDKKHCAAPSSVNEIPKYTEIQNGGVKMVSVRGGKYKVWTKKVGDGHIKVLLLHGGPGLTHEYFECMESFFPQSSTDGDNCVVTNVREGSC